MKFNENLKRICNEQGTTPTALLKEMGVATSKVTMWNNGSLPKPEMLVRLAERLHCSVMDFFADEEDLARMEIMKEASPLDEDEADIIRIFRTLSRREKHEFMNVVYGFEKETSDEENTNG